MVQYLRFVEGGRGRGGVPCRGDYWGPCVLCFLVTHPSTLFLLPLFFPTAIRAYASCVLVDSHLKPAIFPSSSSWSDGWEEEEEGRHGEPRMNGEGEKRGDMGSHPCCTYGAYILCIVSLVVLPFGPKEQSGYTYIAVGFAVNAGLVSFLYRYIFGLCLPAAVTCKSSMLLFAGCLTGVFSPPPPL